MAKGKRLTEDEIKWILSVDASDAQSEILKIDKANRELNKSNKERSNLMRELESQGKKNTAEYKRLEKEIKDSNAVYQKNAQKIAELEKKLDITGLTMKQLRAKAKDLRAQLDNTVKSADPKGYEELEKELNRVNARMGELRNSGQQVKNELDPLEKGFSKLKAAAAAFIVVKLGGYLKDIGMKAYETRKEFAKYEAVLRNSLQSQKKAADAMKLMQKLAVETPYAVSTWTEAYIKLINRGVKPTQDELTSLGDIASSQGKGIDQMIEALLDAMTGENERLKEFGIKASKNGDTIKYTFKGVTTEVANNEAAIKNYIMSLGRMDGVYGSMKVQMGELEGMQSNLGDSMDSIFNKIGKKLEPAIKSFMGGIASLLGDVSDSLDTASEAYDRQKDKVVSLVTTMPDLLSRYDSLKSKTKLSKDEQEELNSVISRITTMVPGAITQWDKYGNAISISTGKVKEFIKEQKALLLYQNKEAIKETKGNIDKYTKELKNLQDAYTHGVTITQTNGMFGGSTSYVDNTEKTKERLSKQINEIGTLLQGAEAKLSELQGDTLEKTIQNNQEQTDANNRFLKMSKTQLEQWLADKKNANDKYRELAQAALETKTDTNGDSDGSGSKKTEAIKAQLDKQAALYEQARIQLKEKYLQGNDEQLQTQSALNEAMEELLIRDLNARLAIMGLEPEQRRQIEQQLLDIKIKALEDFKQKKALLDAEDRDKLNKGNQAAIDDNKAWMDKQMADKQRNHAIEIENIQKSLQQQVGAYQEYGSQIGESLGAVLSGQEDMLSAFGGTMIDILFDVLSQIINQKILEATAVAVAEQAKATAVATALPDSVVTFGASSAARTAVIGGLIMAGLTAAKTVLKGLLTNRGSSSSTSSSGASSYTRVAGKESGGYIDVVRSQDNKMYPQAKYDADKRGYIDRPTVIVGDGQPGQSKEWVASNAAVENPTIAPILNILDKAQQAGTIRTLDLTKYIQAMGIVGRASGGSVSGNSDTLSPSQLQNSSSDLERRMIAILERLESDGIASYVILDEFEKKQKLRDKSRKIGSK